MEVFQVTTKLFPVVFTDKKLIIETQILKILIQIHILRNLMHFEK